MYSVAIKPRSTSLDKLYGTIRTEPWLFPIMEMVASWKEEVEDLAESARQTLESFRTPKAKAGGEAVQVRTDAPEGSQKMYADRSAQGL